MKRSLFVLSRQFLLVVFLLSCFGKTSGQNFTIQQTLSDGAQRNTIAFDGLAFLTGNFCACSFIPPGKVADFFGFQYLRDNDLTHIGHNTDFNTVIANNLLYVLTETQKDELIAMARQQVPLINEYAVDRFPLIDAFIRLRDHNLPAGRTQLDSSAIKAYSASLYKLDGRISLQRARLYSGIITSLDASARHYLDSVAVLGMGNMPVLPDQIDKTGLNNSEFVAVMSYAGDIFSWYVGNVESDVYFCPERQGDYFGGFYIKDAPAMGNPGYSIDTSLTQNGGLHFLDILNPTQAAKVTGLVNIQKDALYSLVNRREDISTLLRGYLNNSPVDTNLILSLSETYGRLDGIISYHYASSFAEVNSTLSAEQKVELDSLRNLDDFPCNGAYLYSDPIGMPNLENTDFLFLDGIGISDQIMQGELNVQVFPNPARDYSLICFTLPQAGSVMIRIIDVSGTVAIEIPRMEYPSGRNSIEWFNSGTSENRLKPGIYVCKLITSEQVVCKPVIIIN
ncbi:MAG: T9SS type A sorting domain-containing protein [Bacteroidetes bacterium]|nr:T9SS type A sorting domain-containing protein [Bacteroidota bacterium]